MMIEKDHLVVKKSKVAGLGLFTLKSIKKGDFICFYKGHYLNYEQFCVKYQNNSPSYVFQVSKNLFIDAKDCLEQYGRYINSASHTAYSQNCIFKINQRTKTVSVYAKSDIPANSELFISYGKSYKL